MVLLSENPDIGKELQNQCPNKKFKCHAEMENGSRDGRRLTEITCMLQPYQPTTLDKARNLRRNGETPDKATSRPTASPTLGHSAAMIEVQRLIDRLANSQIPILIQGESGTGKEVVARLLHQTSHIARKKWVTLNCAAASEPLLESELFGHEKVPSPALMCPNADCFKKQMGARCLSTKLANCLEICSPSFFVYWRTVRYEELGRCTNSESMSE
ncbi:MAG: sigma 54-interacting transcriptional regulator [Pirellulaceae bacterium]